MRWQPRRPYRLALAIVPLLVWLAGGAAIYGAIITFRTRPANLDTLLTGEARTTGRTVQEERSWIDKALKERYLASPPGPPPCAGELETVSPVGRNSVVTAIEREDVQALMDLHIQETSEWLPGLTLAELLVRKGDLRDAEQVVREVGRRRVLPLYPNDSTPDELVLARIHQLHLLGYVWIERNYTEREIWVTLKNPIGFSKIIARRRSSYTTEVPTWVELKLPPPGCPTSADSLTTYDLYNNLIVGYIQLRSSIGDVDDLRAELHREYDDPLDKNPLLAVLRAIQTGKPERVYWVWAVSNAERLLRERLIEGDGYPEDARLALNLAQLMESTRDSAPVGARKTLDKQIDSLVEIATRQRKDISEAEITDFDRALTRLLLFRAARRGTPPELLEAVREHLEPEQQELVDGLTTALTNRQKASEWAAAVTGKNETPELTAALGSRIGAWRSASRQDLAASLALLGLASDSQQIRRDYARKAESMLDLKDVPPVELDALETDFGYFWRYEPRQLLDSARGAALVGGGLGFLLAVFAYWICLQLRFRKELFTSFYRAEVEQRLHS